MSEENLIESFKKALIDKGVDEQKIKTATKNMSTVMDFNYIDPITETYISLEAKTFNDTRSNSNFFLSLFGKIIKGRHLNQSNKGCQGKNIEYGFLFDKQNEYIIKKHFDYIEDDDWRSFCSNYNVKYIFFMDGDTYDVFVAEKFKSICSNFTKPTTSKQEPEIIDTEESDFNEKDQTQL